MKIGVFGLGYVGLTTSACLLQRSFDVIGYELSEEKHQSLKKGICPLSEPGVREAVTRGLSDARMTVATAMERSQIPDVVLICVGTPNGSDGQSDLSAVRNVLSGLQSNAVEWGAEFNCEVVIRSTVPPGTLKALALEFAELFRTTPVVFYPEFLREGSAMRDSG